MKSLTKFSGTVVVKHWFRHLVMDWSSSRTSSVEQHYVVQWTSNEVLEEHDSSIFRARHFKIIYLGPCNDSAL
jgi:hypothetical protein